MNSSNCSLPFDLKTYKTIAAVRAGSGFLTLTFAVFALFTVVLFKKYCTFWQRLILYSNIATALYGLSVVVLRVDYFQTNTSTEGFCVFAGFFHQYSTWTLFMSILCYHLSLCTKVVFQKDLSRLEMPYFILIFLLHLTFNWIPFLGPTYGLAGAWCWIRETNDNCSISVFGIALRYAIWYVPFHSVMFTVLIGYVVSWITARRRRKLWEGIYDADLIERKRELQTDLTFLLGVPLVLILINVPSDVNAIHDYIYPRNPLLTFWILHAFFSPMPFGILALLFTLDRDTRQKLNVRHMRKAIRALCSSTPVHEYHIGINADLTGSSNYTAIF